MNPKRKRRLVAVVAIVLGVSVALGMVMMALNENINLFYTPSQVKSGEVPDGATFRLGGMVEDGSVKREPGDELNVLFGIGDGSKVVAVRYTGILPDLFREGQGIVATGTLDNTGAFNASEVLAKHDENYMPPEAAYAMEEAEKAKLKAQGHTQ